MILAQIFTSPGQPFTFIIKNAWWALGPGVFVLPLAIAGWYYSYKLNPYDNWWTVCLGGIFLIKSMYDLQSGKDILVLAVMLSVGISMFFYHMNNKDLGLVAALLLILIGGVWLVNPAGIISEDIKNPTIDQPRTDQNGEYTERVIKIKANRPNLEEMFLNQKIPEGCHYYLQAHELVWLDLTGRDTNSPCGEIPPQVTQF